MSVIRIDMTISLDGFVAGPAVTATDPMGAGGFRLFNWLDLRGEPGPAGEVYADMMATRALIAGRRTYELAGRWQGDHHDGVPIFVLTHEIPDETPPGSVRYVTDAQECARAARQVAGAVAVAGAEAGRSLLRIGQVDEVELHVVPVLLGGGTRLFDQLGTEPVELDLVRTVTTPDDVPLARRATHLRYRVLR